MAGRKISKRLTGVFFFTLCSVATSSALAGNSCGTAATEFGNQKVNEGFTYASCTGEVTDILPLDKPANNFEAYICAYSGNADVLNINIQRTENGQLNEYITSKLSLDPSGGDAQITTPEKWPFVGISFECSKSDKYEIVYKFE